MRKLMRRPSPAMVVACLALLVALVRDRRRRGLGLDAEQRRNAAAERRRGVESKVRNNAVNSAKVAVAVAAAIRLRSGPASGGSQPVHRAPQARRAPPALPVRQA